MNNPETLMAAEEQRAFQAHTEAVRDSSRMVRGSLTAIANEFMNTHGVIEHDHKEEFISGLVVAISREFAVETGLASTDPLDDEATKQASALRINLSRSEARQLGWTDQQFDELIAQLRRGGTPQ